MVPQRQNIGPKGLLQLLQNAIGPQKKMKTVYTTAQLVETNGGKALSFNQYYSLLNTAAMAHDKSFDNKKTIKPIQGVHQHKT